MKLRIQAINFEATSALESYVNKKLAKLEKLTDDIFNVDVYLKLLKSSTGVNKEVEIKVSIPNVEFFSSKVCETFEEATDLCIDAIEKQIKKHKEKFNYKK
ncbi:MAG TPA: ribosome-associated translation inhibitor RaiA [Paludibacteraceae bacterium]|nr:ribosome-associated translation inhibitor RaiA [Paludibacteraceae bacterium]